MTGKYNDIIHLERPVSAKYPHMSIAGRAAQFAPYKTITVYHDQLDDAESHGNAVFQDNIIIPDADYFEYEEDFDAPELSEDFYPASSTDLQDFSAENLDNDTPADL